MRVDATPVRAHVRALVEAGASMHGIAEAAGVHARLVGRLASVVEEEHGSRPMRQLDGDAAARILEVTAGEALRATTATHRTKDEARRLRASQALRSELIGAPELLGRPRSRREAVNCAVDVARLHALPLDAFVARQLDVSPAVAQDLLRQARCDGLLPQTVRPRSSR